MDDALSIEQVMEITGLSQPTIKKYTRGAKGYAPTLAASYRLENGKVRIYYSRAEFEQWLQVWKAKAPHGVRR